MAVSTPTVHDANELRILLIEDNEGDADLFRAYLDDVVEQRCQIHHAPDLHQAIAVLKRETIDIIVLDLMLPDSIGIETIQHIHQVAPQAPIVVLSGVDDDIIGRRAIQAGANDFLHKNALSPTTLSRSLRYARERVRLQSQFWTLVDNNADAIVVVDKQNIVVFVNKAASALFGRPPEEILGKPLGFDLGGEQIEEITLGQPDGEPRAAEVRAAPIDWQGKTAWLASLRDITDRKRAEELQRRLQHADRLASIGQLASGVAHEVNNPASFIQSNLETLRDHIIAVSSALRLLRGKTLVDSSGQAISSDTFFDDTQIEPLLSEMNKMLSDNLIGIDRIAKIVKALSSFSRIERDEIEIINVNDVIEVACSMTYNEIRHRAALIKDLSAVPHIAADRGKLAQVFTNLLINAAHAIEPGAADKNQIRVVSFTRGNDVVIWVEDSGCGIPEENLRKIFEPFFTTKPRGQGTGLGLPLSADIIRKHGGHLRARSTVGKGTCFEVALPIESAAAVSRPLVKELPKRNQTHTRARILLIDDEDMLLDSLQRMLRRTHEVVMASGGMAGIGALEANSRFDVLVCDLMMPEIDGIEFYKIVSERWPNLRKRIVICSGGAFTARSKEFITRVGKDNIIIEKPIKQKTLLSAVDEVIDRHGRLTE